MWSHLQAIFNSSKFGYRVGLGSKEWVRLMELGKVSDICECDEHLAPEPTCEC
jgi:hypothetical protein